MEACGIKDEFINLILGEMEYKYLLQREFDLLKNDRVLARKIFKSELDPKV